MKIPADQSQQENSGAPAFRDTHDIPNHEAPPFFSGAGA
jgi:hypothetical protein